VPSDEGNKHVDIAVVFAGEGDLRSVGRQDGVPFHPHAGGQGHRISAVAADHPEVVGEAEDDLSPADGGMPEE